VSQLNLLNGDPETARQRFLDCCGSQRWVEAMMRERPFRDQNHLCGAASRIWWLLDRADWVEAFSHHPRIGELRSPVPQSETARRWAEGEQAGTAGAEATVRARLADGNRKYEAKFGYVFLICATGKSAKEMLAILEERLKNAPEVELAIAAGEQEKITRIRLEKLLSS
jgi:2-oxo-4-hydroxy-4-carboxy-5-ureidoimidazoline decarboxylase